MEEYRGTVNLLQTVT